MFTSLFLVSIIETTIEIIILINDKPALISNNFTAPYLSYHTPPSRAPKPLPIPDINNDSNNNGNDDRLMLMM